MSDKGKERDEDGYDTEELEEKDAPTSNPQTTNEPVEPPPPGETSGPGH